MPEIISLPSKDVYKRQAQHCQYILGRTGITECPRRHTAFGFALLQPCHNMVGDIGEPPTQHRLHNDSRDLTLGQLVIQIPVSYTHLDVYKRQAYTQRVRENGRQLLKVIPLLDTVVH